eukprot:TRINITY_DN23712_c0_g1_i1.p1 TRINITY_DN23712_c0_g1~~TRINITY_DN23712_c0_g1_i1.p1  ORF type:complete len:428 (-),score=55.12 TRINITY_DN23712_c0_g1_i1:710-1993(-)
MAAGMAGILGGLLVMALCLQVVSAQVVNSYKQVTCSNIKDNTCRTGTCGVPGVNYTGITTSWVIPYASDIEGCGGYGNCLYTWSYGTTYYATVVDSVARCCALCKANAACKYWQYRTLYGTPAYNVIEGTWPNGKARHPNGGYCYEYLQNAPVPTCNASASVTTVGAKCVSGNNDPHFVGAEGTRFDFNGLPGSTFCLITDSSLHVNVKMSGYMDSRLESASVVKGGKAVRTWMQEMGFKWMVGEEEHSLRLVAREGPETARGEGYLALMEADGEVVPKMQVGETAILCGNLVTVRMIAVEQSGPYEVDSYNLKIEDMLDMDIRLRPAHALLRTEEEAHVHMNFGINSLKVTASVHGVLGQTYRTDREERTLDFAKLMDEFAHLPADGEVGKGFLDGSSASYLSSGILDADCMYTTYKGRQLPASAE